MTCTRLLHRLRFLGQYRAVSCTDNVEMYKVLSSSFNTLNERWQEGNIYMLSIEVNMRYSAKPMLQANIYVRTQTCLSFWVMHKMGWDCYSHRSSNHHIASIFTVPLSISFFTSSLSLNCIYLHMTYACAGVLVYHGAFCRKTLL